MTTFISVSSIKSILEILRRSRNHLNLQAKIHSSVLFLKYNSHFFMYVSFLLLYTNLWLILFLLKFLLILFPQEWTLATKLYFILLTHGNREEHSYKSKNHHTLLNWSDWSFKSFLSYTKKYWYADWSNNVLEIELTISRSRKIVLWTLNSLVSLKHIQLHFFFMKVIEDYCNFIVHSTIRNRLQNRYRGF